MKMPHNCSNLEEVRVEIDRIDREIIKSIRERFEYVKAATKFKKDENSVKAPERFKSMLQQRRDWAEAEGLQAEVIEKLYRDLVNYFIDEELNQWKSEDRE